MNFIKMQKMTKTMHISWLVALAGSILTLIQILLLASENNGICFNDGCEIIDSLTTVPPIFINVGGVLFFQAVFWGIWLARRQRERMLYVNMLLLAGLAAEGVLVSFQHFIAQVFCSYCLIILTLVVLLNLLAGLRHILTGGAVFTAVVVGFSSLQFVEAKSPSMESLDTGSFAVLAEQSSEQKRYLFFSSTCKHCEKVIESLQEENNCTIRFNPIDEISDFPLQRVQKEASYSTDVNRNFLKSMGIDQIPVLLTVNQSGFQLIKGEGPIKTYLQENCTAQQVSPANDISIDLFSPIDPDLLLPGLDDSCLINTDCEDPELAK
jgi:hypothetical protein